MHQLNEKVSIEKRDLIWIKKALQTAIALEHSTLPLYLSSMFSLEVQNYTSYNLLRSIVMEEMVHMAIACNMLSALGGAPQIKLLSPSFPGKGLPGSVEPDLQSVVAQLSKGQLENFRRLEAPKFLLPKCDDKEKMPTISAFYESIVDAIKINADDVRQAFNAGGSSNQVGDNIGFTTLEPESGVDPIDQLQVCIHEITEQGEGATHEDLHAPDFEGEESHYAKFAELYYGAKFQMPSPERPLTRENEADFFKGYKIEWPMVTNILAVPSDGYAKILGLDPDANEVKKNLDVFDAKYTDVMTLLDLMWNGPSDQSWPNFGKAVGAMTELRVLSCFNIMRYQIPSSIIAKLDELYPEEIGLLQTYTNLNEPVFYGPRFTNTNS